MMTVLAAADDNGARRGRDGRAIPETGADVSLAKVLVGDLAAATDGRMTESQVRYVLDRGAFPHETVRLRFLRELWRARTVEALLIDVFQCQFEASRMDLVTLHALGHGWEATLGGGAYRPDGRFVNVDEEDLKLLTPIIDTLAMALGTGPAAGEMPVMLANDVSVAYNATLREAVAGLVHRIALPDRRAVR